MGLEESWPDGDGKVYVGNLDYGVDHAELTQLMNTAGKVLGIEIPVDNKGRSRGHAIVRFESSTVSLPALLSLNLFELRGRRILVREDREPVGRRGERSSGSKDVKEERVQLQKKKNGKGKSTVFPVSDTSNNEISFESKKNKGQARQSIIRPKIKLDEESAGALVYYGNIPWSVGNGEITEFVGGIDCQIPTDKRGRSKGYALIQYSTTEEAAKAIAQFNECEWLGRSLIARLFEFKKQTE